MKLTGLTFENYKAFRKRESIEIRPLTILIGRNSSGKSVITRFPLLLAHALSNRAESPLDMKFDGLNFGSSFLDIVHNRNPHGAVSVGASFLSDKNEEISVFAKIQYFSEYRLQHIEKFKFKVGLNESMTLVWRGNDPLKKTAIYHFEEENIDNNVWFQGIRPVRMSSVTDTNIHGNRLIELSNRIMNIYKNPIFSEESKKIDYLGPFRDEPRRKYEFSESGISGSGLRGEKAPALLARDFLQNKSKILSSVSNWFTKHLGNWELDISIEGDYFSLVLKDPENPEVEINIADAGTGIAQVLPIVVQRHLESAAGKNSRSSLEIVEQPGLHLHPGAHGPLADLYVDAVKSGTVRCLIETHSENFLLRIRRRIADGTIKPEDVIIYWVKDDPDAEERIQPIHIDADGEVDFWPPGVFSEDFEEVREIRKAQKKNNENLY